jgi:anti-anti-sigma factor
MEFNVEQANGSVSVSIIGPVDNENAEELKNHFSHLLEEKFSEAIFDLSFVPFITSSGIGKFLIFYQKINSEGRRMRIKGINDNLLNLFKSIKLDILFPIEK